VITMSSRRMKANEPWTRQVHQFGETLIEIRRSPSEVIEPQHCPELAKLNIQNCTIEAKLQPQSIVTGVRLCLASLSGHEGLGPWAGCAAKSAELTCDGIAGQIMTMSTSRNGNCELAFARPSMFTSSLSDGKRKSIHAT
jgi:hypothetical protein